MSRWTDGDTGWLYMQHRFYDPYTGQFTSRDPLNRYTRSPYGYVNGSPLNRRDPSGLDSCPDGTDLCGTSGDGSDTSSSTDQSYTQNNMVPDKNGDPTPGPPEPGPNLPPSDGWKPDTTPKGDYSVQKCYPETNSPIIDVVDEVVHIALHLWEAKELRSHGMPLDGPVPPLIIPCADGPGAIPPSEICPNGNNVWRREHETA